MDSPPELRPAAKPKAPCGPDGRLYREASPPDRKGWSQWCDIREHSFRSFFKPTFPNWLASTIGLRIQALKLSALGPLQSNASRNNFIGETHILASPTTLNPACALERTNNCFVNTPHDPRSIPATKGRVDTELNKTWGNTANTINAQ